MKLRRMRGGFVAAVATVIRHEKATDDLEGK